MEMLTFIGKAQSSLGDLILDEADEFQDIPDTEDMSAYSSGDEEFKDTENDSDIFQSMVEQRIPTNSFVALNTLDDKSK